MTAIAEAVTSYTAKNSNYDVRRNYISMSHAALNLDEIVAQWNGGFEDSLHARLKCYKGYQMERDLMQRIIAVFGERIKTDVEYTAFDGLVQGHPDFEIDGLPGDCKSVLMDDWLPKEKLPRRIYWQMQAYMLYSGKPRAVAIFESRESGKLVDFWIAENKKIQLEIDSKFTLAVGLIRK